MLYRIDYSLPTSGEKVINLPIALPIGDLEQSVKALSLKDAGGSEMRTGNKHTFGVILGAHLHFKKNGEAASSLFTTKIANAMSRFLDVSGYKEKAYIAQRWLSSKP